MTHTDLKFNFQKIKNLYHLGMALLASIYYGFPAKKIKIIAITGTDGKTTTTALLYHILKFSGKKVSMISTVFAEIGGKKYNTGLHTTTPDSWMIQRLIKQAVKAKDEYLVLEVTSHALDQFRTFGVKPEIGLITNITHEHLDYHVTFDNYLMAKVKLLLASKLSLINKDHSSFDKISEILRNYKKSYLTFGFKNKANYSLSPNQLESDMAEFNKYNFLAAFSVCRYLNIPEKTILDSFKTFIMPLGRLETVFNKGFRVIIDFAHTPNALDNVLSAVKKHYVKKPGRLIHVFGSAGERDFSKRPLMGQVSAQYADKIILTEEDYRSENPDKICQQISQKIPTKKYLIIKNRYEAIDKAIETVKKNDVILLTGKGHEQSLCRGKTEFPWSEHKSVNEILKKYDYI